MAINKGFWSRPCITFFNCMFFAANYLQGEVRRERDHEEEKEERKKKPNLMFIVASNSLYQISKLPENYYIVL